MKKHLLRDCRDILDIFYESDGEGFLPFLTKIRMKIHFLFCASCSSEYKNLQSVREIMKTGFVPASPGFEDIIMNRVMKEAKNEKEAEVPAGFSFRFWVVIGFFMLLSLASVFFGNDFINIADAEGLSFLLPIGLTVGMVVTGYGAFFIGSHLEELSARFRLR